VSWNHRIVRHVGLADEIYYTVHEVYYDDDDNIEAWTDPVHPYGESEDELWRDLLHFVGAFNHPVLNEEDLPHAPETS
jgi:hypothetical protein